MIKDAVYELYKKAAIVLGNDVKKALEDALKVEDNELARLNIEAILKNIKLAEEKQIPMCQDTGLPVIFVKLGNVEVELIPISAPKPNSKPSVNLVDTFQ